MDERTLDYYRDPFRKAEWREPLFWWAMDVGLGGDAPASDYAINHYNEWYLKKTIPSLEIYGHPGEVTNEYDVRWRVERLKNHETVFVGPSLHFIQEDHPEAIGRAIADWYRRHLAPKSNVWMTDVGPEDTMPKNLKLLGM
jgi:haloalkane dehalogenase